jgi:hypothetical protein
VTTPENLAKIDDLLHTLKCPSDWPSIQDALTKTSTLKIAEAMALAGDMGQYVLSLLDIDAEYRAVFIRCMMALNNLLRKVPKDLNAAQELLVNVLGELESMMPLHWCTSTRHFLLHIVETIRLLGAFWAWNMLCLERFHVLIKKLAKDTRDRLRSLSKYYQMFDLAQMVWRNDGTEWANKQAYSTIRSDRTIPMAEAQTAFRLPKTPKNRWKNKLPPLLFVQLLDLWCAADRGFRRLKNRFERSRRNGETMATWEPSAGSPLTDQEKKMKTVDRAITVN